MPPNRRHHLKSRHGCNQCKARRTKCDEVRPICTKCARKGSACSFSGDPSGLIFVEGHNSRKFLQQKQISAGEPAQASTSVNPFNTSGPRQTGTSPALPLASGQSRRQSSGTEISDDLLRAPSEGSSALSIDAPPPALTALESDNLRLMRHFTSDAWRNCMSDPDGGSEPELRILWSEIIPELACSYPFLLHSLLAVAAQHYALLGPSDAEHSTAEFHMPPRPSRAAMANLAQHHLAMALPLMREALEDETSSGREISNDLRPPLFVTACLVSIHAFALPLVPSPDPESGPGPHGDPMEAFCQTINLLHGISSIVRGGEAYLLRTPFRALLLPRPRYPDSPLDSGKESYFSAMRGLYAADFAAGLDPDPDTAKDYALALGFLRHTYVLQRECPGRQMIGVPFAVLCPDRVLADMKEGKVAALCLAAGYAVVMHWLRRIVWMQGWGKRVVGSIAQRLRGTQGETVVEWCVSEVSRDEDDMPAAPPLPIGPGNEIKLRVTQTTETWGTFGEQESQARPSSSSSSGNGMGKGKALG